MVAIARSVAGVTAFRLEIDRSLRPCSSWIVMFMYVILLTSERVWGWGGSGLWFAIEASHNERAG